MATRSPSRHYASTHLQSCSLLAQQSPFPRSLLPDITCCRMWREQPRSLRASTTCSQGHGLHSLWFHGALAWVRPYRSQCLPSAETAESNPSAPSAFCIYPMSWELLLGLCCLCCSLSCADFISRSWLEPRLTAQLRSPLTL